MNRRICSFFMASVTFWTVGPFAAAATLQVRRAQAGEILAAFDAGRDLDPVSLRVLQELNGDLTKEVQKEIEAEALARGLSRDQYVFTADSFNHWLETLDLYDLNKLDRLDLMILGLKTGARLRIQNFIRFLPDGHSARVEKVEKFQMELLRTINVNPGK